MTTSTQPGLPRWMQRDWAATAPLKDGARPLALDVVQKITEAESAQTQRLVRVPPRPARRKPVTILAAIVLALVSSLTVAARGLALPDEGLTVHLPAALPEDAGLPEAADQAPTELSPEDAAELRDLIAQQLAAESHTGPTPPSLAFTGASALDSQRAQQCLADAVYYEAGLEPEAGKRAVAQVILNRVRHPEWPDSVCGVVYQGSERTTGCQFTFTCDGALARPRVPAVWNESARIARQALAGRAFDGVGLATHYHTFEVWPYWGRRLTMTNMIGRHLFHRLAGRGGAPGAFTARYTGHEAAPRPWVPRAVPAAVPSVAADFALPQQPAAPNDRLPAAPSVVAQAETPRERNDNLPDSQIRPEFRDSGSWIGD